MGVLFIWNESYSVGSAEIDSQHRRIFTLANSLPGKLTTRDINAAIMALFRHIREHFVAEEKMMKAIGFPETADHRELHDDLITRLSEIAERSFRDEAAVSAFRQFVYDWLTDHILNHDMRYVRFARETMPGLPLPMEAVWSGTGGNPHTETMPD
jgi:hemerythrin